MAIIRGTFSVLSGGRYNNNADSLMGTASADTIIGDIYSASGNDFEFDTIDGKGGDDVIFADTNAADPLWNTRNDANSNPPWGGPNGARGTGGDGNDTFYGGGRRDEFLGGTGNDKLYGYFGGDQLDGQDGNDLVLGGNGGDAVAGGRGADVVRGGADDDFVYGEALVASNAVVANDIADKLYGDAGDDNVYGGAGADLIYGGTENDRLFGASSNGFVNTLFLDGADKMYGEAGDDVLDGNEGNDLLDGGTGNDRLDGGVGSDTLIGGAGNDADINGGFGDPAGIDLASYATATSAVTVSLLKQFLNQNTIGAGVDFLRNIEGLIGSGFADTLIGDSGNNVINGGAGTGADRITGGFGADKLTGGLGADQFIYSSVSQSGITSATRDIIYDLKPGDRINIDAIDANNGLAGDQDFVRDTGGAFVAGEVRVVTSGANCIVYLNVDGDSAAEASIVVIGRTTLGNADFDF